ncbi:hypothetical protein DFR68_12073 [Nocardia mexicana]|uniref:WXG100 family type VII secretion target n=1 Tax=Nocardia mexicana TaxID=279262 RepID=A0A370GK61_9NOCA|nr:hypothetical protein DFR68_12073 [Nocardia mexicana]
MQLENAAAKTEQIGDDIESVLGNLSIALDTKAAPWGDDAFGKKFADGENGYKKARDNLMEGIQNMRKTLDEFADGQKGAVIKLEKQEGDNVRGFRSPGRRT